MASTPRVTPEEAKALIEEGFIYVDVRSEPEFERGHVPGALNVPFQHKGPTGFADNSDFERVMGEAFAKDERLLIGCQSGARSAKATGVLERAGFTALRELKTGFGGSRDAFGRALPGWAAKGFNVETGTPPGSGYDDVQKRKK